MKCFGAVPFDYKGEIKYIISKLKKEFKYKFECKVEGNMIVYSGFTKES